jgi:hypothetical protein
MVWCSTVAICLGLYRKKVGEACKFLEFNYAYVSKHVKYAQYIRNAPWNHAQAEIGKPVQDFTEAEVKT